MYRENKIKTRDFGEITVKKEDIINFADGMYGFEDYKRYIKADKSVPLSIATMSIVTIILFVFLLKLIPP